MRYDKIIPAPEGDPARSLRHHVCIYLAEWADPPRRAELLQAHLALDTTPQAGPRTVWTLEGWGALPPVRAGAIPAAPCLASACTFGR